MSHTGKHSLTLLSLACETYQALLEFISRASCTRILLSVAHRLDGPASLSKYIENPSSPLHRLPRYPKAMIELSYSESTHAYAGETFSFHDYADVKGRITRATSSSSALQYRYAIWELFKAVSYVSEVFVPYFNCFLGRKPCCGSKPLLRLVARLKLHP